MWIACLAPACICQKHPTCSNGTGCTWVAEKDKPDAFFMLTCRTCICAITLLLTAAVISIIILATDGGLHGGILFAITLGTLGVLVILLLIKAAITRRHRRLNPEAVVGVRVEAAQQRYQSESQGIETTVVEGLPLAQAHAVVGEPQG